MRALANRLRVSDDRGVALVMAIVIMAVVTIAAASAIAYTDGSQRDAFSKKSGTTAYSLAQAAISLATTQLTAEYYDSTGQPRDNSTALSTMASSWKVSGTQMSPTNTATCTIASPNPSCMTWSSQLNCPSVAVNCPGGSSISVSGAEQAAWHITGTGSVYNPSGTAPITRTITVDVPLNQIPGKSKNIPDIYKSVYSGGTGQPCDMTMAQGTVFSSPVYVKGNLCITNPQAGVIYSGTLTVGGYLYISNGGVGTSSSPISSVAVVGACNGTQSMTPACTLTKPSGKTYYTDTGTTSASVYSSNTNQSPSWPTDPKPDFTKASALWSSYTCTGVESLGTSSSTVTFDLAPSTGDYTCTQGNGFYIKWHHLSSTLEVNGSIYIFGDLVTNSGPQINYQGIGGIYVQGTTSLSNNTEICATGFSGTHDCTNGANWDTSANFLMLIGQGAISGKNLGLQGGLYSYNNIDFSAGQTSIYGPLVTSADLLPGQQAASGFPVIQDVYNNWPGVSSPYWTLGTPVNGTY
jgi:hypothetical protein